MKKLIYFLLCTCIVSCAIPVKLKKEFKPYVASALNEELDTTFTERLMRDSLTFIVREKPNGFWFTVINHNSEFVRVLENQITYVDEFYHSYGVKVLRPNTGLVAPNTYYHSDIKAIAHARKYNVNYSYTSGSTISYSVRTRGKSHVYYLKNKEYSDNYNQSDNFIRLYIPIEKNGYVKEYEFVFRAAGVPVQ